jgi:CheY-like chemotaxis protein
MAKTILIVEDDPYVQRFYDRLFKQHEYSVVLASGGEEGLAKARELKPALILLDVMMPGMNGIEVLEKLKSDPETKDLTVIMLTNVDEDDMVKKAAQLGARDFIVKADATGEALVAIVNGYTK